MKKRRKQKRDLRKSTRRYDSKIKRDLLIYSRLRKQNHPDRVKKKTKNELHLVRDVIKYQIAKRTLDVANNKSYRSKKVGAQNSHLGPDYDKITNRVCVKRKLRRQTLFSRHIVGKGGHRHRLFKPRKMTEESKVRC